MFKKSISNILRTYNKNLSRHVHTEANMKKLNIELPELVPPKGNYISYVKSGNMAYLSGHLPLKNGTLITGVVGKDLNLEQAQEAARCAGLQLIGTMKLNLGDLDKVKRIVRVGGFVQCTNDFNDQALVTNGCSDLMHEVFGERGLHVRTSVGTNSLPLDICVEIDCIIEFEE